MKYCDDYSAGELVKIKGTPLHNGKTGTIVEWRRDWGDPKPGLIPVFMPEFPSTHYWWFAPHQLETIKESPCES